MSAIVRLALALALLLAVGLALLGLGLPQVLATPPGDTITTVAGTGVAGSAVHSGPAMLVQLRSARGVAVGPDGSVYVADGASHWIRKVTPDGMMTTVAGTGFAGSAGDGGPATGAQLSYPSGVALGPDGSLYIADTSNHRARKVVPDGTISTVAGTGLYGFAGDGGPATGAQLSSPSGVALGPDGSLYTTSTSRGYVRKVSPDGIIRTVATGIPGPAVAVAADGTLYVPDYGSSLVLKVLPTGIIATAVGRLAQLLYPEGVALGPDGSLYIGDTGNSRVRKVSPDGIIRTVAGSGVYGAGGEGGAATGAQLNYPNGVAVAADGGVYVADTNNYRIRRMALDGTVRTVAGGRPGSAGDGGPAILAELSYPNGVALGPDGSLYIADTGNNRIRKVTPDGVINRVAGTGVPGSAGDGESATGAQLRYPDGVAVSADGSVYIADTSNNRVRKVLPTGVITTVAGTGAAGDYGDGGPAVLAGIISPKGVAVGPDGSLYIAASTSVRKVSPDGIIRTVTGIGYGVADSNGVAVGPEGGLYIADRASHRIWKAAADGRVSVVAGTGAGGYGGDGGPAVQARLNEPRGVAVGPDGSVYIADTGNHRIRKARSTSAVTPSVRVRLVPDPVALSAIGAPADVRILLEAGAQPVDAAEVGLAFNPALVQVLDGDGDAANGVQLVPGPVFQQVLTNTVSNSAGSMAFAAGRGITQTAPGGSIVLATIRLQAVAGVTTAVTTTLAFDPAGVRVAFGGQPLPTTLDDGEVQISYRLVFRAQPVRGAHGYALGVQPAVAVQDAQGNTLASDNTTVITLTIKPGTGASGAALACHQTSGGVTSAVVVSGTTTFSGCTIDRTGAGYVLQATATGRGTGESAWFNVTWAGDTDADCRVSVVDYSAIVTHFGKSRSSGDWTTGNPPPWQADVNGDERVSVTDYSIVVTRFGTPAATCAPPSDPSAGP